MAVDYAKRKAPKKRAAPKRKKPAAPKPRGGAVRNHSERSVSNRRLILTIIAFVGFIALLVVLKMRGGEAPPPVIPVAPAEDPLPEMPEERWRYIQELENKQVEVVVPERAEAHPRLMQCGSFRREAEADALRAQIAFIGLESQIRRTEGTQGMWYRVVLGPFENQRAAQRTNNQLQRAGVHGCQIWNWTDE